MVADLERVAYTVMLDGKSVPLPYKNKSKQMRIKAYQDILANNSDYKLIDNKDTDDPLIAWNFNVFNPYLDTDDQIPKWAKNELSKCPLARWGAVLKFIKDANMTTCDDDTKTYKYFGHNEKVTHTNLDIIDSTFGTEYNRGCQIIDDLYDDMIL